MKLIKKRFWSLLLCTAMVITMLPAMASAATTTDYVDGNGITQTVEATVFDGSSTTLTSGWYVVNSTMSTGTITINGDVKLILADGASLTATDSNNKAGIGVIGSNCLSIYGQSGGTGTLIASGAVYGAGIGGSQVTGSYGGTINIYGGIITASSKSYGAGIGGGGGGGSGSTVNIYGGIITALGTSYGAGIGGGSGGSGGGTVSIYGGTVTATSWGGAGIGGGYNGAGSTVNIYGGKVAATSTDMGAGIGGGANCGGGAINIYGGTVTAKGSLGPDIGAGPEGSGGTCVIAGGSVNAATILPAPTNGSGNGGAMVYRTAVTLKDISTSTKVNSLTTSAGYYSTNSLSTNSLYTDVSGKLYLWMPVDTTITAAATAESTAAGGSYLGTVTTTSSGTASGNLIWNHAPTDIALSASTVAENTASGSTCGTLSTIDANTDDTFTYSLVSGDSDTDNSAFSISGQELKLNVTPDYETKNSYSIRIRSTDAGGLCFEKAFTITILYVNKAPSISAPTAINAHMDTTTSITGISFTDSDAGSSSVTTAFNVTSGTLTATSSGGVTVTGTGTTYLTLSGSVSNINAFLGADKLTFLSEVGGTAPVTLAITVNDNGNTGLGGALTASTSIPITILFPATITSIAVPVNGSHKEGDTLDFTVNFSKVVTVDTSGGTPYLLLTMGSSTVCANYLSGSGTTSLIFRYTVVSGDNDSDGVSLGNFINLNNGTIQNEAINAVLTLNSIPSTSGVLVDTAATAVVAVIPANTDVNVPVSGAITVTFGEPMSAQAGTVTLTKSGSSPITLAAADGNWTDSTAYTIPYSALSYATDYTVTISGFQDMTGNVMTPDNSRSFTTEAEPLTPSVTPGSLTVYKNELKNLFVTFGQGATAATGASITVNNINIASASTVQVTTPGAITVTGLAVGTTNITIAFNDISNTTETVTVTVLPATPVWLSGSTLEATNVTSAGATLTWTAAQDGTAVTGYKLYQNGTLLATVSGTTTSYVVSGLFASTVYSFHVQAGNSDDMWTTDGPGSSITTTAASPIVTTDPVSPSVTNDATSSSGSTNNNGTSNIIPAIIQPEEKLIYPIVTNFDVKPTLDRKGHAAVALSETYLTKILAKALEEAKAKGKTESGIVVAVNIDLPDTASSLGITLSSQVLKTLIDAGIKQFEINGELISMNFDLETLSEIKKQSTGDVTISITRATGLSKDTRKLIGTRPVYNVTLRAIKGGKTVKITRFNGKRVTLTIPYTVGKNENTDYLKAIYVDGSGKPHLIEGSAYDTNNGCITFTTSHFAVYGVGYKAPSTK